MKKKNRKKWLAVPLLLGLGYLAIDPRPLYAFMGFGDIVFDPESYASLGHIWASDASNGVKLAETYNETVKIVSNGLQLYSIANAMAHRIQNKDVWKMAAFAVGNEITTTHYNEQINFNAVMNGDWPHAGTAWHQSTLYGTGGGYLGGASAQNSSRMASFATMQMMDQTSQRCAEILGQYKSTQDTNVGAESALESDTFDMTDAKNSMMAGLNVLAGGRIHMQTQARANGNLQTCLAEQQTLQTKLQRDNLAAEQNWYSDIVTTRSTVPSQQDAAAASLYIGGSYLVP